MSQNHDEKALEEMIEAQSKSETEVDAQAEEAKAGGALEVRKNKGIGIYMG